MKTTIYLLCAMLATAMVPAGQAVETTAMDALGDGSSDHEPTACGGGGADPVALLTTSCSNGVHAYTLFLTHGFLASDYAGGAYTGTVTSEVEGQTSGNVRSFTCTLSGGAFQSCAGSGSFPVRGEEFEHRGSACAVEGCIAGLSLFSTEEWTVRLILH